MKFENLGFNKQMKTTTTEKQENKCDLQGVVESYRVEAISITDKKLHSEIVVGFKKASELYQDLKIKYYQTYTSVKMTEL